MHLNRCFYYWKVNVMVTHHLIWAYGVNVLHNPLSSAFKIYVNISWRTGIRVRV